MAHYHMRRSAISADRPEITWKAGKLEVIKTVRGVLRPAFQMAVDNDVLMKNPFGFELATAVVNDSMTREAITKDRCGSS